MLDQKKTKLHREVELGDRFQRTWDEIVQPFFDAKQEELFDVFKEIPAGSVDDLDSIHRQSKALEALRGYFMHFIESGQLAKEQLKQENA